MYSEERFSVAGSFRGFHDMDIARGQGRGATGWRDFFSFFFFLSVFFWSVFYSFPFTDSVFLFCFSYGFLDGVNSIRHSNYSKSAPIFARLMTCLIASARSFLRSGKARKSPRRIFSHLAFRWSCRVSVVMPFDHKCKIS